MPGATSHRRRGQGEGKSQQHEKDLKQRHVRALRIEVLIVQQEGSGPMQLLHRVGRKPATITCLNTRPEERPTMGSFRGRMSAFEEARL